VSSTICSCEETLAPNRITPPTSPRRTRSRRSPDGVRPAIATISFWPISSPMVGASGDGSDVGLGVGVAIGDGAGVGVGSGVGCGDGRVVAVADSSRLIVDVGEGEAVPSTNGAGRGDAIEDGVGLTVTGIEPRESALTPLSSAEPAITRAAMTTRALFIAYQTPGQGPDVHPIVRPIAEMNVSVDLVRLLV